VVEKVTREGEVAGSNSAGCVAAKNVVTCDFDGDGWALAGGALLRLKILFCYFFGIFLIRYLPSVQSLLSVF
jgi:hypothetical protein